MLSASRSWVLCTCCAKPHEGCGGSFEAWFEDRSVVPATGNTYSMYTQQVVTCLQWRVSLSMEHQTHMSRRETCSKFASLAHGLNVKLLH
eukprot:6165976-Amphidinium_carterae.2